jgi:uncharacterized protein YlxW (UPF0749 family)
MLGETTAFGLGFAEWAIIAAALIFSLDVLGISRSGRTARRQNADLRERNATLEGEVRILEEKLTSLERQVEDLKSRSVDALLAMMREHDIRMTEAADSLSAVLGLLKQSITQHEDQAAVRHEAMIKRLVSAP